MPKSKIDKTLKNIVEGTSKEKSKNSSNVDDIQRGFGDPNCPLCGGIGYLRHDLPIEHPDFGKISSCSCRNIEITRRAQNQIYAFSQLNGLESYTFETFSETGRRGTGHLSADSIKFSFNETHKYAQNLQGWLLLQGGYGSGKTHLAAAIANYAVSLGVPTIFQTVPDLLEKLRSAYGEQGVSFQDRLDQIQTVQLLVLDDFGTQNATGWAQEKLFQIINYRYINRLSTVVTTNLSLDEIEGRIRSRLQDVELVKRISISAPDYRRDPENQTDELSSLHLLKNRTFASFSSRRNEKLEPDDKVSLQEALKVAQAYSKHPEGWVVFTGDYGCGKTHLAAAIGHECKLNGLSVLFMEVPTLLDYLRSTFNPNSVISFDNQFNKIRTAPLLILDDFGIHSATPWAREKLYQIFNHRYNAQLPTVITISADELENIDPRIDTRMKDPRLCLIVSITAPPFHSATKRNVKKRYQQN